MFWDTDKEILAHVDKIGEQVWTMNQKHYLELNIFPGLFVSYKLL